MEVNVVRVYVLCVVAINAAVLACGPGSADPPSGGGTVSAGGNTARQDAGTTGQDAGTTSQDAGMQPQDGGTSDADGGTQPLDTSAAGLTAFARSRAYQGWHAEPAVHASAGPHGKVRVFVNDALYASMKAGASTHPAGSVAVKELYAADGVTLTGHAIDVKEDVNGSARWVFYEGFTSNDYQNPYYFQGTNNFCASCHASGTDYVLIPAGNFP